MVRDRIMVEGFVGKCIEDFPDRPVDSKLVLGERRKDMRELPDFLPLLDEIMVIPDEAVVEGVGVEEKGEDEDD